MKYRLPLLASACAVALSLSFGAAEAEVSPLDLVQPIADYKIYIQDNLDILVKDTKALPMLSRLANLRKRKSFIHLRAFPMKRSNRLQSFCGPRCFYR